MKKSLLLIATSFLCSSLFAQHSEWCADNMPSQADALVTYQDYWGAGYMVPGMKLIDDDFFKVEIEKPFVVGTNESVDGVPYTNFIYMGSTAGRDGFSPKDIFLDGLEPSGMLRNENYSNAGVEYSYNDAIVTMTVPAAPEGSADGDGFGIVTMEYFRGANMNAMYVVDATGERIVLHNRTRCEKAAQKVHRAIFGVEPGHTYYIISSDRLSAHFYKITFDACASEQYDALVGTSENTDEFWTADNMPDQADALATYQDYWGGGYMVPGLKLIDTDVFKAEIEKPFVVGTNENVAAINHTKFVYMGSTAGRDGFATKDIFLDGLEASGMLRNENYSNAGVEYAYNDAIVTMSVPAAPEGSNDGYGFGRVVINYNRGSNMNALYVVDATAERMVLLNRTRCPKSAIKIHTAQFGVEPGHTYYLISSDRLSVHLYSIGFTLDSSDKYYTASTSGISTLSGKPGFEKNVMYNILGQRVNGNAKGIVIMNGKKLLVK